MQVDWTLRTNGRGLWSTEKREVRVTGLELNNCMEDGEEPIYELLVHFDPATWDVRRDGLIYTDPMFLKGLRKRLQALGLPPRDVDYSEQGMQGDTFVSLDAGNKFGTAWSRMVQIRGTGC